MSLCGTNIESDKDCHGKTFTRTNITWNKLYVGKKQVGQTQIQIKIKFDKYQEGQTLIGTNMNRMGCNHEVGQT